MFRIIVLQDFQKEIVKAAEAFTTIAYKHIETGRVPVMGDIFSNELRELVYLSLYCFKIQWTIYVFGLTLGVLMVIRNQVV